ncbi:MAG: hypothetical protein JNN07_15355 [Verrucomicrobiales bacterium]|nr:hypothetical protein [Verrucomicrobiales bacterium]
MSAADPSLHSLAQPIPPGDVQFTLREAAGAGEASGVEAVYRPYRERDVKKTRSLNLWRGWMGSGSRELIRVQREEFRSVRQSLVASGSNLTFAVSLRCPDAKYGAYQLQSVRVVAGRLGHLEFERWSTETPILDAGFGLQCSVSSLRGEARPSGLAAQPLRGSLPLWPTLRTVDLQFSPVEVPVVRLFESTSKHHWDGWRQTIPQGWPGGRTIVLRQVNGPTVWREHEYYAFPPANEPPLAHPVPPSGVMSGIQVEVFWPEGGSLDFPETRFETSVEMIAVALSKLPPRMAELLAHSVRLRPGIEPGSISAQEWRELEASVPELELPLSIEMAPSAQGSTALKITRRPAFTEAWVCTFAAPYDDARRFLLTSLLLRPERWIGPVPE